MLARHVITATVLSAAILLVAGSVVPAAHADWYCTDAAACLASFDDDNPGDNHDGDSGADRDRSRSRDNK